MHADFLSQLKGYIRYIKPDMRAEWKNRNKYIFQDHFRPIEENKVNLFWTGTYKGKITEHENLGDYLSTIVVGHMLNMRGLDMNAIAKKTSCLYAIGSIIGFGLQDATIWGSGLLRRENAYRLVRSKLDIRAVRGPYTRKYLSDIIGKNNCPEVYGDPAVLMPAIYTSKKPKKYVCSIILHHSSKFRNRFPDELKLKGIHYIEIMTTDYRHFIDEIVQSEIIISSALHGIILAESYAVPAIYLKDDEINQDLKFMDWYSATGRNNYLYVKSIDEALKIKRTNDLPCLDKMREALMAAFPYDLWD